MLYNILSELFTQANKEIPKNTCKTQQLCINLAR